MYEDNDPLSPNFGTFYQDQDEPVANVWSCGNKGGIAISANQYDLFNLVAKIDLDPAQLRDLAAKFILEANRQENI